MKETLLFSPWAIYSPGKYWLRWEAKKSGGRRCDSSVSWAWGSLCCLELITNEIKVTLRLLPMWQNCPPRNDPKIFLLLENTIIIQNNYKNIYSSKDSCKLWLHQQWHCVNNWLCKIEDFFHFLDSYRFF